jgi:hypothetical protein
MISRRWMARLAALVAGSFLFTSTGSAYYYYTYFNSTSSPFTPIVARFDLNTLSNNTVPFFISGTGPSKMYPGDSVAAMLSQINAAANVWNNVSTSSIRLAYGGFFNPGTTEAAPGIQIEFSEDIPPGLLAISIPTIVGGFDKGPNGTTFLPIFLSVMQLPSDMSNYFASYSEQFFVTVVHEFGHTLGLQHTLASSVMATLNTSASSKATPLGDDDVAGISLLYPASNYLATVGSISGTVTMNGAGVNLASVVAISPSNQAIATLTNPDGTYQINGIKPGEYFVYVHPLPQPVQGESTPDNIYLPLDSAGAYLAPNTGFATQFYPNTLNPNGQAQVIPVTAGQVASPPVNFSVTPLGSPGIGSVRTYGYTQNTYVIGAPVMMGTTTTIAATGVGLLVPNNPNNVLTPGLSIGMLGSAAQISNLRAFAPGNPYIAVDATPSFTARQGPLHLLFNTPGNLYVLPSGFSVVQTAAPLISALGPAAGGGGVAISGGQFTANTQILFDGVPAAIQSQTANILIVTPPLAPASYTAAVAAFNPDGQSSLLLNPAAATYTYPAGTSWTMAANPSVVISPSVITADGAVTLTVKGSNTNFVKGLTTVGFGTSDVQVNQVTVDSPNQLTIIVTPTVSISSANITITTGLEVISQAVGSQITATDPQ